MRKTFVLGSINVDMTIATDRLPMIGESKPAHDFMMTQGGKGANQAIAAKRLNENGEVFFIGAIGNDKNGEFVKKSLEKDNINIDGLQIVDNVSTGVCVIILDESQKDNLLLIDKGANEYINTNDALTFLTNNANKGDIFISQLETNLDVVEQCMSEAKKIGMFAILNPAPACNLNKDIYKYVDLIVPNTTETKLLTDIDVKNDVDIKNVYNFFNVPNLIITLGSKGSAYFDGKELIKHEAIKCDVVDTTCAGDTFIGALASKYAQGVEIKSALDFARRCSSITVSRKGSSVSIPYEYEMKENK